MNPSTETLVIALGGNAISRPGEEGNIADQFRHTGETVEWLANLIAKGMQPVITHGNGPQVGNILRRVELSLGEVYPIPLHLCVADTQAGMGHMITQCLNNALVRRGKDRLAATLVTHVVVDADDPAFSNPDKPIGRAISQERAEHFAKTYGWEMREYPKVGWRRVVASPRPRSILEIEIIQRLVREGEILVVGGGGGIAVRRNESGEYFGVDCVIDKDRTTALLAAQLGVELFVIATGVNKVMLDYSKPTQRALDLLTLDEARRYLAQGQFPAGTMGPKIEAAVDFLEKSTQPNPKVLICELECIEDALEGRAGTVIVRG